MNFNTVKTPIVYLSKKFFPRKSFNTNYCFRSLNEKEIDSISKACQEFSDCYLVSSLEALSKSKNGREILKKNIEISPPKQNSDFFNLLENVFKVSFANVKGKKETFIVGPKEMEKNFDVYYRQNNKVLYAIKIGMKKLVNKHFFKKPLISRLIPFKRSFEYNKPSTFLEMFTGKKPIIIAESEININLKKHKNEVFALFEKMAEAKDNNYSFIVGTGIKGLDYIKSWHCLVVDKVDNVNKIITLKNKRANGKFTFTFDEIIHKFKYIVGYFNENLK